MQAKTQSEMLETLDSMEAQLQASLSANNLAMQSLGVDRRGWSIHIYSLEAENIWTRRLSEAPKDFEALHHLAVLHHARAFDIERSQESSKSDRDWRLAMQYWKALLPAVTANCRQ